MFFLLNNLSCNQNLSWNNAKSCMFSICQKKKKKAFMLKPTWQKTDSWLKFEELFVVLLLIL